MHKKNLKKTLEPLIEEARKGNHKIFFMDAAHFVYGAFQGYLWSFERVFIKTGSGRQRFNVLGAYDPIGQKLLTVENENIVNAKTISKMLHKIRYQCGNENVSIILDNAKYQHCDFVIKRAKKLKINLIFLPTYSPNLNLIERYWKYVKKTCLNSIYHLNFSVFKTAIINCLRKTNIDQEMRNELSTLMTLKFQIFKESQFQAA